MLTCSTLGRYGRFANGLFQIAGCIGLARKHGYAYGFPEWKNHDHAERFGSQEDIDVQKYFVNPLPRFDGQLPDYPVSWGYHSHLPLPDNVSISGHFQSDKYFRHCMGTIRHYFTMKDEPEQSEAVAIHWRLGDYDDRYHPRLKADYYIAALRAIGPVDHAKVYSDEIDMATGLCICLQEETGVRCELQAGGTYLSDFRSMKRSKHFITGNSSFSLMAAILGDHPGKKIVCPSNWFGEAWGSGYRDMAKDIYPERSVVI